MGATATCGAAADFLITIQCVTLPLKDSFTIEWQQLSHYCTDNTNQDHMNLAHCVSLIAKCTDLHMNTKLVETQSRPAVQMTSDTSCS